GLDVAHAPRRPETIQRAAGQVLTSSRRRLPTLKNGTRFSGTLTLSPVFGFRPLRELRCRMRKLPNPRSSTLSPRPRASVMLSKTVLTMSSVSFLVSVATFDTSSINSAFVMKRPPSKAPLRAHPVSRCRLTHRATLACQFKDCQAEQAVRGPSAILDSQSG